MSVLGWSGREGEYSCRSRRLAGVEGGDGTETVTCISGEFVLWLQPAELSIGVMSIQGGAQATEQAARFELSLKLADANLRDTSQ